MEFPRAEIIEKYVRIYDQWIAKYNPDFEVEGGMIRYVRFNDAWRGLNPYNKLLISRLTHRKDTFPKKPIAKLAKNANPVNYITQRPRGRRNAISFGRYWNKFGLVTL